MKNTSYKLFYGESTNNYIIESNGSVSSLFSLSRLIDWLRDEDELPPLYEDYNRACSKSYQLVLEFDNLEELINYFMEYLI